MQNIEIPTTTDRHQGKTVTYVDRTGKTVTATVVKSERNRRNETVLYLDNGGVLPYLPSLFVS
jgi:hypothetical protein